MPSTSSGPFGSDNSTDRAPPCGVSFTVFNENNFVLYHTNRIAPADLRRGCPPVEEEVPQARLHQLAFGASFSNVVDAPILSHGAPWLLHIDPMYVAGGGGVTAASFAVAGGSSTAAMNGLLPRGAVTTAAERELKHYRVTITSAFAVNVSPSADSMAVRQYAVALVLTAKTGAALQLLLQFPLVLRHMMNHVLDLGVRLTTEALEHHIRGVSMKETALKMTSGIAGVALLKTLHAALASVLSPIAAPIAAVHAALACTPSMVRVPLLSAQALSALSQEVSAYRLRCSVAAKARLTGKRSNAAPALPPPPPSSQLLSSSVSVMAFQRDLDRYYRLGCDHDAAAAASPTSPSRGRRTQQQLSPAARSPKRAVPPDPSLSADPSCGATPCVDMSAEFSRALRELTQFNANFLSAVVSGILSVSMLKGEDTVPHRHPDHSNHPAAPSGIYADFLAMARRDSAAVPPQRRRVQRCPVLNSSQPTSTINGDDDDDFTCVTEDDDELVETGSPTTSTTNTAPPSSRGGGRQDAASAAPSVYHQPPHALSYHYSTIKDDVGPDVAVPPGMPSTATTDAALGLDAPWVLAHNAAGGSSKHSHRDAHAQSMPLEQRRVGLYASSLAAAAANANDDTISEFGGTVFRGKGLSSSGGGVTGDKALAHDAAIGPSAPHAANRPEARIFIFATDVQAARNLMIVAAFLYRHHTSTSAEHTAWVLDAVGRDDALSSFPAMVGHAASPDAAANLSLLPSLPIVWVPEEWNPRVHRDQLSHRLSPETLVLVIAHRTSLVERVVLTKCFSTRNITVAWRPNQSVLKEFPYGTCGGCFSMETARCDTVIPNQFAKRAVDRALAADAKSKGAVSAAMYLEEWIQVLWQQRAVYAMLQATGGRCNVQDAQRVLSARPDAGRMVPQQAAAMLTVPRHTKYASGMSSGSTHKFAAPHNSHRPPVTPTASSRSSETTSKGMLAEMRSPLVSTDDARRNGGGGAVAMGSRSLEQPRSATSTEHDRRVENNNGLADFNRDLREALQCNEVDATHVQLLHFLSEL